MDKLNKVDYRYPPLYKYILFTVIAFMFLNYYKTIPEKFYLYIALFYVSAIIALDYILIDNHPDIFYDQELNNQIIINKEKKKKQKAKPKRKPKKKEYNDDDLYEDIDLENIDIDELLDEIEDDD
jgi:hypothetical protein